MIINLSCTTATQPGPKMERRLSYEKTVILLNWEIQSASLRLISTSSTNCTHAQPQRTASTTADTANTARPGLSATVTAPRVDIPASWQSTARSHAISAVARTSTAAVLTGQTPGNTANTAAT